MRVDKGFYILELEERGGGVFTAMSGEVRIVVEGGISLQKS